MDSVLGSASVINPQNSGGRKVLSESLMLTSLVDAFSILVIFLLLNFSNSENFLVLSKDMVLPAAKQWAELEKSTVIKIENHRLFVGEEEVAESQLLPHLVQLRRSLTKVSEELGLPEPQMIIQADRSTVLKEINAVISHLAQAGFSDINFAVLQE